MTTAQTEVPRAAVAANQSIARGALGTALLHAVRANDPWAAQVLHHHVQRAFPLVIGDEACLQFGAPALAFVLHIAAEQSVDAAQRYRVVRRHLDDLVVQHTQRRLDCATDRMRAGLPTAFREYDLLRGLAGLARLHLLRHPDHDITAEVLGYLIELTQPVPGTGDRPGWWVWHHHSNLNTPGGHTNAGIAHGISGPLAVLSIAIAQDIRVPGDTGAVEGILTWLDQQRVDDHRGPWWRRWPGDEAGRTGQTYWCYGTPGIARAEQLAALALGDVSRAERAERTHLACLADARAHDRPNDLSLCHGVAGLLQATRRIAADSLTLERFRADIDWLQTATQEATSIQGDGLLEGTPGLLLARDHASTASSAPWDACLGLA
ncbi:lanthionine synthetase C family protein [Nocardioides sp. NPDC057772]|uniref:lanthionine synthetase C family protein n=1 Tax=Nocardioides sp. NPDC057772 TaxID=3346245 RepID=UPI0036714CB9